MRVETAREFLETPPEELLEIEGMSKELLLELRQIILIEFDEKENQAMKDRIQNAEIGYLKDESNDESAEETDKPVEQTEEVASKEAEEKETKEKSSTDEQ